MEYPWMIWIHIFFLLFQHIKLHDKTPKKTTKPKKECEKGLPCNSIQACNIFLKIFAVCSPISDKFYITKAFVMSSTGQKSVNINTPSSSFYFCFLHFYRLWCNSANIQTCRKIISKLWLMHPTVQCSAPKNELATSYIWQKKGIKFLLFFS